ncbi:MAG: hypothetical protein GY926_21475 [bacterium]|nr:hypothetical protein [bacterium]MCP4967791.1 hypothetical protein [bacterium]
MDENTDYRGVLKLGLRRASLHWLRAGYEVVAGVGAFLDEVARSRRDGADDEDDPGDIEDGPIRIELD